MIKVFTITNPFNPQHGLVEEQVEETNLGVIAGQSKKEEPWLCVAYINGERFFPLREEWDLTELSEGDAIYFLPKVAGGFEVLALVLITALSAASVFIALSVKPPTGAEAPEADPVYSLRGRTNKSRLGDIVEDPYGRNHLFPSFAANPYTQYDGNDEILFQLLCYGHGSYETHEIKIEDTPIANFPEIEYEIYEPGESVTLFPDNVTTSTEVAGSIRLFADNEDDGPFTAGPFVANDPGTIVTKLEVDVTLPKGLYLTRKNKGTLARPPVEALWEYRVAGSSDPWTTLKDFELNTGTDATKFASTTPLRYTFSVDINDVVATQYEVRAQRTNDAWPSTRAADEVHWSGLRAFLPSQADYGDKTLIAVKAKATNNLNDSSSNRINVDCTRKLPNVTPAAGENPTTLAAADDYVNRTSSRSPVWAAVNILRAKYGRAMEDEFLDLEFFLSEANQMDTDSIFFDWVNDERLTVWEALRLPLNVMKSVPIMKGSLVSFIRDAPGNTPSAFFNPENIVEGSFLLEKKLFEPGQLEGYLVEYIDGTTWEKETVKCVLPGQSGDRLKRVIAKGITDRQRAFEWGMYLNADEFYQREQLSIETENEGHIPTYGDIVRISVDVPKWIQSGYVLDIVGNDITLSDQVDFSAGGVHQIALRGRYGQDLGPYTVTAGTSGNIVVSASSLPMADLPLLDDREPPFYVFGPSSQLGKICRVRVAQPNDNGQVSLRAVLDDQRRHADYGTAPAQDSVSVAPVIPSAPVVVDVEVFPIEDSISTALVTWRPTFGAREYFIQRSEDGVEWRDVDTVITATSYVIPITAESTIYVRVAARNTQLGPFDTWTGQVGVVDGIPDEVETIEASTPWTGSEIGLKWDQAIAAAEYELTVYTDTGGGMTARGTVVTTSTTYAFTAAQLEAMGALARDIRFDVVGRNTEGDSPFPATVTLNNPIPSEILGTESELLSTTDLEQIWRLTWTAPVETDIRYYRVWASATSGFTADTSTLVYEGTATSFDLSVLKGLLSDFPEYYWRVSAVDYWADENSTNRELIVGSPRAVSNVQPDLKGRMEPDERWFITDIVSSFDTTAPVLEITDANQVGLTSMSIFTFSVWVQVPASGSEEFILGKWGATNKEYCLVKTAANTFEFRISTDGSTVAAFVTSTTLANDSFQHVIVISDGSNLKIYVGGVLEAFSNFSGVSHSGSNPFRIGKDADGANDLEGEIGVVTLWERVLTTPTIVGLTSMDKSTFDQLSDTVKVDLVSCWENNQVTGQHLDRNGFNPLENSIGLGVSPVAGPVQYRCPRGAGVIRWTNLSTHASPMGVPQSNSNRSECPTLDVNDGLLRWDGSVSKSLKSATGTMSQPFSIITVAKMDASPPIDATVVDGISGTRVGKNSSDDIVMDAGTELSGPPGTTLRTLIMSVFDGASSKIIVGGTEFTGDAGTNDQSGLSIGGDYIDTLANLMDGTIERVYFLDRALTAEEITDFENDLG